MKKKAAFIDRDGTINKNFGYVHRKKNFAWLKNSKKAIKYLKKLRYLVIVISNQSGIARKYYTSNDVQKLHIWMNQELKKIKTKIDAFYISDFHPKYSKNKKKEKFRKPNIGLINKAANDYNIDLKESFMIGDSDTDKQTAKNAKILFVKKKYNLLRCVKVAIKKLVS